MSVKDAPIDRRLEIQGHRGARGLWPENTLHGFAQTLALGVDALELDVALSRDGVVMVHHDSTLNPMTTRDQDGHWIAAGERHPIFSLSVDQLSTYDVGALKIGTDYANKYPHQQPTPGARIPTLNQVIEMMHERGDSTTRLNIEAKLEPQDPGLTASPAAFADALLDVLNATNMAARANIQSFDWRVQAAVRERAAHIPIGFLSEQHAGIDTIAADGKTPSSWTNGMHIDDFQGSVPRMVQSAGGSVWSPNFQSLGASALREAHDLGLRVVVWTVNAAEDIGRMIELGVDGIISDYPDRVRGAAQAFGLAIPQVPPQK